MTYGWAILVVLVAIGALAYFGVLNPEQFLPEKCVISTGSGLFCADHSIDDASTIRLNVHNILTEDVTGVIVTLTNGGGGTGSCANAAPGINIAADATEEIPLVCTGLSEKVKADLSIAYTKGTFAKQTTGNLVGRVP